MSAGSAPVPARDTAGATGTPAPSAGRRPPRCYVASPLGFTAAGRHWYRQVYLPALESAVEVVDPWSLTSESEIEAAAGEGRAEQLCREIGARNTAALRTCTVLVALLDGQEPDAGTVAELGYAAALGLTCFGLRTDLRQSGEAGARCNLQVQAFVLESGGEIVSTLEELLAALSRHGRG